MSHTAQRLSDPSSRRPLRLALLALQLALLSPAGLSQQQPAAPQPGAPAEMVLTVTVTDAYGRNVVGLGREAFAVTDGKAAREIVSFRESGAEPLSLGLVFDVSGSMEGYLPPMRAAAARLLAAANAPHEYFVAEFGGPGGLRLLADWTRDESAVRDALGRLATADSKDGQPRPKGMTYRQDACADALAKMSGAGRGRRAIILFGDTGHDTGSRTGKDELRRKARESGVLIYGVIVRESDSAVLADYEGQTDLDELTGTTGGRAYFVRTVTELSEAMDRLALEFAHQYLVGFAPAAAAGVGKLNKLKVRVTKPASFKGALRVRSRDGYYSPAGQQTTNAGRRTTT